MRTEGWGLHVVSFYTRIKSPHHYSQGLTKKKNNRGCCVGEINVHPPPCKPMQTCKPKFFWVGYYTQGFTVGDHQISYSFIHFVYLRLTWKCEVGAQLGLKRLIWG